MAPVSGKSAEPVHYKLYGVLYHRGESQGESTGSGHYTIDVLHPIKAWLRIDHEAVSAVQHEEVFGSQDHEWGDDRCVYMLFYCRTAPARTR
jgi:ubiquitin C-terminal hydrolase